jgi:hypothetical protein
MATSNGTWLLDRKVRHDYGTVRSQSACQPQKLEASWDFVIMTYGTWAPLRNAGELWRGLHMKGGVRKSRGVRKQRGGREPDS